MIIINLKGGIGNQMFQYAFGKKLSLKNSDVLKLEIDGLERANAIGDIYRPFSLGAFNVTAEVATAEEVQQLKYPYGIISKGIRFITARVLKKTYTLFDPTALTWKGDRFLDGYWQSPDYFTDIRDTLLTEFTLKTPLSDAVTSYKKQIESSTSVSMHIRRGDYAKNPQVLLEFGICEASYYQKAMEHMRAITKNPTFFIFSDDIQWVQDNLSVPESAVFVQHPELKDVEELALMSMCAHNIIANSTFSWWGAWLNTNDDKVVIVPTPWFERRPWDKNLIPTSWTLLPKSTKK
jgi:hypothetical protein